MRDILVSLEALQKRIDKCEDMNLSKIVDLNVNVKTDESRFWCVTPVKINCLNVTSVRCMYRHGRTTRYKQHLSVLGIISIKLKTMIVGSIN